MTAPDHKQIAERAYQLWETNGKVDGNDLDYWLQAETEILSEAIAFGQENTAPTGESKGPSAEAPAPAEKAPARKAASKTAASKRAPSKASTAKKASASAASPDGSGKAPAKKAAPRPRRKAVKTEPADG